MLFLKLILILFLYFCQNLGLFLSPYYPKFAFLDEEASFESGRNSEQSHSTSNETNERGSRSLSPSASGSSNKKLGGGRRGRPTKKPMNDPSKSPFVHKSTVFVSLLEENRLCMSFLGRPQEEHLLCCV